MKQLTLIGFLFVVPMIYGATFNTTTGGDITNPVTWGFGAGTGVCHSTIPCMSDMTVPNGDIITVANDSLTISCPASTTCSVGNSPNSDTANVITFTNHTTGTGGIHLYPNSILVYAGGITLKGGKWQFDDGARLQHDSSWATTPIGYQIQPTSSSTYYATLVINSHYASPSIIEGDSFYSPLKNPTACTTANTSGCMAGVIGTPGAQIGWRDQVPMITNGPGTGYIIIRDVAGTSGAAVSQTMTTSSSNVPGIQYINDGAIKVNVLSSATGSYLCDGCIWTLCQGTCLTFVDPVNSIATGSYIIRNSYISGRVVLSSTCTPFTGLHLLNVMYSADPVNHSGVGPSGCSTAYSANQVFYYQNSWTTGSGPPTNYARVPANTNDTVLWQEKTVGGQHLAAFLWDFTQDPGGTATGDVLGAMGPFTSGNESGSNVSSASATVVPRTITGYAVLCGADGLGTEEWNINNYATSKNAVTFTQGVHCSHVAGLSGVAPWGAFAMEGTTVAGAVTSINSILYFNATTGLISEMSGGAFGTFGTVLEVTNNALINTNSSTTPAIGPGNTGQNWVATGGGPSNETIIVNTPPNLVDPWRSVPLFTEYLDASGLLPIMTYTRDPNYYGAWSAMFNGHGDSQYHIGDIAYIRDSALFNGRTTYWRCIEQHTPSATLNKPIVGVDAANNPYMGHERYWEEAWIPWYIAQVTAGTAFNDGAINCSSAHTTVQDLTDCGINGVLNKWLLGGMVSMQSSLWTAGKNGVEIGLPTPTIRHVPPPMMSN